MTGSRIAAAALLLWSVTFLGTASAKTEEPLAPAAEVSESQVAKLAGITPDKRLYGLERAVERLQLALTRSEERLAKLHADLALERAAEAAVMAAKGEERFALKAAEEYAERLDRAAEHLQKAVEAADKAVEAVEALHETHAVSQAVLPLVLERVPERARVELEQAVAEKERKLGDVAVLHAAKRAFAGAKAEVELARKELKAAKKSGDAVAVAAAEARLEAAEAAKTELEKLKDAAELVKEEAKRQSEEAREAIKKAEKQLKKADKQMDKAEEKAREKAKKAEEKAKKDEKKEREEAKKAEKKDRKESRMERDRNDDDDDDDDDD